MSREIKFRAHGQVYPKWFYGYYVKNKEGDSFIRSTGNFETYWVLEETLGQFTGLHDKNGKEIYEGDVVSWSAWKLGSCYEKSCKKKVNIVEWSSNKGKWFIGNDLWDLGIYSDIEVIGNIHENPEILEKNND